MGYKCSQPQDERNALIAQIVNDLDPDDAKRLKDSAAHLCDKIDDRRIYNTGLGPLSAQELILIVQKILT